MGAKCSTDRTNLNLNLKESLVDKKPKLSDEQRYAQVIEALQSAGLMVGDAKTSEEVYEYVQKTSTNVQNL
jgi:hypothetical protein